MKIEIVGKKTHRVYGAATSSRLCRRWYCDARLNTSPKYGSLGLKPWAPHAPNPTAVAPYNAASRCSTGTAAAVAIFAQWMVPVSVRWGFEDVSKGIKRVVLVVLIRGWLGAGCFMWALHAARQKRRDASTTMMHASAVLVALLK